MNVKLIPLVAACATMSAGCATTGTRVLAPYQLANGAQLQDVVTIAGDPGGGAASITAVSTYDVSRPGQAVLVARDHAAERAIGALVAGGFAAGIPIAAGVVGAAAIRGADRKLIQSTSYSTSGNISYGGDAGDIDAANQAIGDCRERDSCTISN